VAFLFDLHQSRAHSFVIVLLLPVGFPWRMLAAICSQQERALRYALKSSFVASVDFDD
jgi:hypothetical protein